MQSFQVRSFQNRDVRWVEVLGAPTAAPAAQLGREIGFAFESDGGHERAPTVYLLDLSGVVAGGAEALEAILDAIPPAVKLALIPPPEPGWYLRLEKRHALTVEVFANQQHALCALGLESRGKPRERPNDNRRHARIETALRSKIWFDHPKAGPRFGQAFVSNLSRRGACLRRLDFYLPIGTEEFRYLASGVPSIHVELALGAERRRFLGRVVRVETSHGPARLGVYFDEIDPLAERALAAYVAERCPQAS